MKTDEATIAPGWSLVFMPQRIGCMRLMTLAAPAAEAKARIDAFLAADPRAEFSRMHIVRGPRGFRPTARARVCRRVPPRCVRARGIRIVTRCRAAILCPFRHRPVAARVNGASPRNRSAFGHLAWRSARARPTRSDKWAMSFFKGANRSIWSPEVFRQQSRSTDLWRRPCDPRVALHRQHR